MKLNAPWNLKGKVLQILGVSTLALVMTSCCETTANVRVKRGAADPSIIRGEGSHVVVVCPKEPLALGWLTTDANSANLTDVGTLSPVSGGVTQISAGEAPKDYVLTAKGSDCDATDTAKVIAVTQGTHFTFSAKRTFVREGVFTYEANLVEDFYSPSVHVTSWRLNSPLTIKGWNVRKVDPNGTVSNREISNTFDSPWTTAPLLVGMWTLLPIDPSEIDPSQIPPWIEVELTLQCGS